MSEQELDRKTAAWLEARNRYPDLSDELTLEEALYTAQRVMADMVPEVRPPDEASLRAAWAEGKPAFGFEDLPIDWPIFSQVVTWLGGIVVGSQSQASQDEAAWRLGELAEADPRDLSWLARSVYEGVIQGDFEDNLIAAALKPFLWEARKAILPHFVSDLWPNGWCPTCGAGPDFASVSDASGPRLLYCSRCDTEWSYRRVGCPFCGNTNQQALSYYPTGDDSYRLYICASCRCYLKTMDLRQSGRGVLLPLDRTLTYRIDQAAKENGCS